MTNNVDDEPRSDVDHCRTVTEKSEPSCSPLLLNKTELHPINMPVGVWVESVRALAQEGEAHSKREKIENG